MHSPVSDMSVGMGTSDACVACTYRATYQELGITADTPISRVGLVEIVGRNSAYERIAGGYERFLDWRNANPWFSQAVEIGVVLGTMRGGGMRSGQQWKLGGFKSDAKWSNQLEKRGWTKDQISEAIAKGEKFPADNLVNKDNLATRYVHPETGSSVVVDNVTKEVIHVGGPGFKY